MPLPPADPAPFAILFVCLGNICRSPAAENVLRHLATRRALGDRVRCDSAGVMDWHTGKPPDPRMIEASARRGIRLTGRARPVTPDDFGDFDLILAMDRENLADLERVAGGSRDHVRPFCEFVREFPHREVPDPYFGGDEGFELVLDLLEDGCTRILDALESGALPSGDRPNPPAAGP